METPTETPATEPRVPITVMIRPDNKRWLDDLAHEYRLTRADVVRICLAVAKKNGKDLATTLQRASEL